MYLIYKEMQLDDILLNCILLNHTLSPYKILKTKQTK